MDRWRTSTEQWLSIEQHGQDDAAETAFTQVFAALPTVDPSAGFVQRATEAAWLARRRERRIAGFGALAACIATVTAGAGAYWIFGLPGGSLVASAATLVTSSAVSLILAINSAVQWWFATVRAGNVVAGIMTTPQSAILLLGIELIGLAALYTLQRLLRAEPQMRGPGALCF